VSKFERLGSRILIKKYAKAYFLAWFLNLPPSGGKFRNHALTEVSLSRGYAPGPHWLSLWLRIHIKKSLWGIF
jgi:hypothetical protein